VAAHRTRGGHRRFAVADLKRLSAERWKPTVRLSPAPRQPLLALAALLDRDGQRVIAAVVRGLYENPRHGWFRSDRARRPLHQWVADVGRACRSGEYQQLDAATARLVRHAQVAGASTLECVLFMERFGAAVVKSLTPAGKDLRHAVVAGH
jgi:hypothetical protein